MPAAYQSSLALAGNAATTSLALPTGTAAGDLIVAHVALRTATLQTFSGATLINRAVATNSNNLLWFVVSSADITAGNHTVSWQTSTRFVVAYYRITGADTSSPIYSNSIYVDSLPNTAQTVNQLADGVNIYSVANHINTVYTLTGVTERHDTQTSASGTGALTGAGGSGVATYTGTSPGYTHTNTAGGTHNVVIASIRPLPTGPVTEVVFPWVGVGTSRPWYGVGTDNSTWKGV